jgi:hypothetical protein
MKRCISIPFICWLILCWSCSEDFLERYPLDELSPEAYFRTANDLKLYANSFYPLLPSHSGYGGGTFWAEQNSDNMAPVVAYERYLPVVVVGTGVIFVKQITFWIIAMKTWKILFMAKLISEKLNFSRLIFILIW